jgi:ParB-like chromosome segregation protein Spo0J
MTDLTFHPVADVFPLMDEPALADLAEDIKRNGLALPILLHSDGSILDGRNRYLACERAGVAPQFVTWDGSGSPLARVVSLNKTRRHLTQAQLALVAHRIANLPPGVHAPSGEGAREVLPSVGLRQIDVAELLEISPSAVQRGRRVMTNGVPELITAVQDGTVTLGAAAEVAKLPADEQRAAVESRQAGKVAETRRWARKGGRRDNPRSRSGRRKRLDRITQLAEEGHDAKQIGALVQLGVERVRQILKTEKIACPGERATRHTRKHDPNRIVEQIATDADNLMLGIDLIDFTRLADERIHDWIARLEAARNALALLVGRLRKEERRHGIYERA